MSDVTLSKAVRSNLLHLQNTSRMMDTTQERLATGKKVNSALDNPTNFFTASSLNARASDIATLLDSMSNGIRTIEAADNGLTAITKTIESMQSTLRQARQDKSFQVQSYGVSVPTPLAGDEVLTIANGALAAPQDIALTRNAAEPASTTTLATGLTTTSTLEEAGIAMTGDGSITIGDGTDSVTFNVTDPGTESVGALMTAINTAGLNITASLTDTGQLRLAANDNTTEIVVTVGGDVTAAPAGLDSVAEPRSIPTPTCAPPSAPPMTTASCASRTSQPKPSHSQD
jgi:flagellin